jgi:hypothetical protein
MKLRIAMLKFYMRRIWLVLTGSYRDVYILRAYECKGDELIKLAEKANGLCIRKF